LYIIHTFMMGGATCHMVSHFRSSDRVKEVNPIWEYVYLADTDMITHAPCETFKLNTHSNN